MIQRLPARPYKPGSGLRQLALVLAVIAAAIATCLLANWFLP